MAAATNVRDHSALIGQQVEYVAVSAHGCEPVVTTGTITAVEVSKRTGQLSLFVEPTVAKVDGWSLFGKWRNQDHIVSHIKTAKAAA